MLKIQDHIKKHGLEKTIKRFALHSNFYDHKVALRYDSLIKTNFKNPEVRETRGLILEMDTWEVMCLPLYKFFNYTDGKAATIDWESALVLEKRDGSLVTFYHDWVLDKWCVSTMGTAEAEGRFNIDKEKRIVSDFTMGDLCIDTIGDSIKHLDKSLLYVCELTSSHNKVIVDYDITEVTVITIRNQKTLKELSIKHVIDHCNEIGLTSIRFYHYNSLNELLESFKSLSLQFEGYVVVDKYKNRIKVKNPAYRMAKVAKTEDDLNFKKYPHRLISVAKSDGKEDFIKAFPETKDILNRLHTNFQNLLKNLKHIEKEVVYPKNISEKENKLFATNLFKLLAKNNISSSFGGLFFQLKDGKDISIENYIYNIDNKKLYKVLK